MNHSEAIRSLAKQFDTYDWLIYTECSMRSDCIPDLLLIKKAYARPDFRIFEIKVSESDLRQDVRGMKFQKYFDYADRVFFALGPEIDVEKAKELLRDQQVGIMSYRGDKWVTNKPAPRLAHKKRIDWEFFLALMIGGKQFGNKDRYSRMEQEKMHIMKRELEAYYHGLNKELAARFDKLAEESRKLERLKRDTKEAVIDEIRGQLFLHKHKWGSEGFLRDMFDEMLMPHLRKGLEEMKDRLVGLTQEKTDA